MLSHDYSTNTRLNSNLFIEALYLAKMFHITLQTVPACIRMQSLTLVCSLNGSNGIRQTSLLLGTMPEFKLVLGVDFYWQNNLKLCSVVFRNFQVLLEEMYV